MKSTMINQEHIEGRLYDHTLELKTVQNKESKNFGKTFIAGDISIAVDEEGLNIIDVHFTYVTNTTTSGKNNPTFSTLEKIINQGSKWIDVGPESATLLSINNTTIALREFFDDQDQLISTIRNEGGFVSIVNALNPVETRNTFTADMIITKTKFVEANPERGIDKDYLVLHGAVFNFRKALLPVEFVVRDPNGIEYFQSIDYSEPFFTKVTGRINNITTQIAKTEDTAFSGTIVKYVNRNIREWEVLYARKEPYEFGLDNTLTMEELKIAQQNREVVLAEELKRQKEYRANKNIVQSAPTNNFTALNKLAAMPGMNISVSSSTDYDF